jgi:hypothetical protein
MDHAANLPRRDSGSNPSAAIIGRREPYADVSVFDSTGTLDGCGAMGLSSSCGVVIIALIRTTTSSGMLIRSSTLSGRRPSSLPTCQTIYQPTDDGMDRFVRLTADQAENVLPMRLWRVVPGDA